MAIVVRLSSEWDPKGIEKAVKDINKAGAKLDSISANTKKSSDAFGSFNNGLKKLGLTVAATFGAREIGRFFASSIKGAIELEAAQNRLRKILLTTGGATNTQISLLLKQADALEKVGVVSKENIIVAQAQLSTFDLNADTIKRLTPAILDYVTAEKGATASADDFKSMTNGLAQALQGNFASLTKTGFVLDEATKKQIKTGTEAQRVTAIIGVLNSTYKGFNQSLLDTPEGKIIKLRQGFEDLKEEVGFALLDSIDRLSGSTENFAKQLKNLGTEIGDVVRGATLLVIEIRDLASALGFAEKETTSLMDETVTFGDKILILIPVLGAYLKILKDQGKQDRLLTASSDTNKVLMMERARALRESQKALDGQTKGVQLSEEAQKKLIETQEELKRNTTALTEVNADYAKFVAGTGSQSIEGATTLATSALASIQKLMTGQPKINKGLVTSFKDLASVVQQNFTFALNQAQAKLEQATQKYNDFKDSIRSSITGVVSFTTIEEGSTFLDSLTKQSKQAEKFGGRIQKLLTMGLNQTAISNIAEAGFEVGTTIADEIIAGGSTIVQQVNTLTASVESVAESVSTSLADSFYSAGVNAAQNLVDAIIQQLNASAAIIAKAIADATKGGASSGFADGTTTTGTGSSKTVTVKPGDTLGKIAAANNVSLQSILDANKKFTSDPKYKGGSTIFSGTTVKIPGRANGGPVTSGSAFIVGERGPELFMPNTGGKIIPNNQTKTGSVNNFNITINAGIGTNPTQVGKEIVDAIKKFEKTSGPVFASA
jgi:LysM repeat protein